MFLQTSCKEMCWTSGEPGFNSCLLLLGECDGCAWERKVPSPLCLIHRGKQFKNQCIYISVWLKKWVFCISVLCHHFFLASFSPGLPYFLTDIYQTSSFSSNYIKTLFNGSWGYIRGQPTKLKTEGLVNKRLGKSSWHACCP